MADSSANARLKEGVTVSWNPFTHRSHGKPSKIYDYCIDPQREGKTCIWLCRRQGYSFVAWDVAGEDVERWNTVTLTLSVTWPGKSGGTDSRSTTMRA